MTIPRKYKPRQKVTIGERYGNLLLIGPSDRIGRPNKKYWRFKCDCGAEVAYTIRDVRRPFQPTKSCGCSKTGHVTHGMSKTPEYNVYRGIVARCTNPSYKGYGARGIKICDRWRHSFENFLSDMGPRPTPKHSIDRIDVNGDYEPSNCRWATRKEQQNNIRTNIHLSYKGETKTLPQWCDDLGLRYFRVYHRIFIMGWSAEKAFETKSRRHVSAR